MKEKYVITKKSISMMGGVCFILFALVTLLSNNTPFQFLSNIITYSFGFIGFWIVLPYLIILGAYLIFKRSLIKIKVDVTLWGFFIVIVCLLILCSHWASWHAIYQGVEITGFGHTETGTAKYLTFSNSLDIFNSIAESNIASFGPSTKFGGGKVGFILAGAINSSITPIGLNIVCWILFACGCFMIFNTQVKRLIRYLKHRKNKTADEDIFKEINLNMEEVEPVVVKEETPKPVEQEQPVFNNKPIFESFHTSAPINNDYDLKKAHFEIKPEESRNDDENYNSFGIDENAPDNTEIFQEQSSSISVEPIEQQKEFSEPFFEPLLDKEHEESEEILEEPFVEEIKPQEVIKPKQNLYKDYIYPSIDLLNVNDDKNNNSANEESCRQRVDIINNTFKNLGIGAEVISYTVGPSVTRFDVQTHADSTVTAIQKYITDISVRLNGEMVRFEAIVAGKSTSGLEIPNEHRTNVLIRDVIEELPVGKGQNLQIPFGKSITGELKYANLVDFPHMLIAGCTGSGKSIFVHSIIITLLMRNKPDELKLIMVDPKKVEMNYYDDIPHLLCPVISDMQKVYVCFTKLVNEMEQRYTKFQQNKVRDIKGYNELMKANHTPIMPYIVVFIDEYADLVENYKEIKEPVVKLVQKARAAGIHIIFATQRPSVNVVDGNIKANVSTRVALSCASYTDSMTVLGTGGAEKLLGFGDMLVDCPLISRSLKPRVQGCYVSEVEINRVCDFLREHYQPQFDPNYLNLEPVIPQRPAIEENKPDPIDKEKTDEEAYQRIKEDACQREYFSISYITRTYGMGFTRAGKMFSRLQAEGIVSTEGDSRGCKVLAYVPGQPQNGSIEQSTYISDEENN